MNSERLARLGRVCGAGMLAGMLAGMAGPAVAQSADSGREKAILVLDASGSMWGQIDGVSKIEIARDQISGMLDNWDRDIDLGLIAYGHRQKGACEDIEVVVEPGPLEAGSFSAAVNAITPVGKTPLSDSVRRAAESMRYTEERATVILLSDGLENCNADPCALAQELEQQGIDFTAHVIGFDLSETDAAELSCLAEETGGEFFLAGNADSLAEKLRATVETMAEATPEPEPEPVVLAPEPEPEPEPTGPFGLRAVAKMCETCDALTKGVFWQLFGADQKADGKREELNRSGSATAFFEDQAPDDYYLSARVGDVTVGVPVTVPEGELVDFEVVLGAGTLRVRAEASPGGTSLDEKMFYRVFSGKADLSGNREEIARSGSAAALFTLQSGTYQVAARHGSANQTMDVEVKTGELTDVVIDMQVGYAKVAAIPAPGADPLTDKMFYRVFDAKKDLQGNQQEISASGSANPIFRLPAGDYVLEAKHGEAFARAAFSVEADSLTEKVIEMNVGYLGVTSAMAPGMPALSRNVLYRVMEAKTDLQGKRREISASGSAEALFRLPAGDYRLSAKHGAAIVETDFSVEAGARSDLEVVMNSAMLQVEATLQEGGPAIGKGVFWRLLSEKADLSGNRKEITASGSQKAQMVVPAGGYIIRARYEGEEHDFPIALTAGEVKEMTVLIER
ncbi:MAG: VWA domain-containing protein [Pseudomonadota bacterium]